MTTQVDRLNPDLFQQVPEALKLKDQNTAQTLSAPSFHDQLKKHTTVVAGTTNR